MKDWISLPTLLESIEYEIYRNGGRMTMIHEIMQESPSLFSAKDRQLYAYKARESARAKRKQRAKSGIRWSREDVEYLLENYGKMRVSKLGKILDRSPEACIKKFFLSAPPNIVAELPEVKKGGHY